MEIELQFLEWTASLTQGVPRMLSALPVHLFLGILVVPLVLAAFSRNGIGVIGTGILTLLTYVLLMQAAGSDTGHGLPLTTYSAALLMALGGFEAASRKRHMVAQKRELEGLRTEMRKFLDALDRRAKMVDMMTIKGAEGAVTGERSENGVAEGSQQMR